MYTKNLNNVKESKEEILVLAKLEEEGFNVPKSIILEAKAFKEFMVSGELYLQKEMNIKGMLYSQDLKDEIVNIFKELGVCNVISGKFKKEIFDELELLGAVKEAWVNTKDLRDGHNAAILIQKSIRVENKGVVYTKNIVNNSEDEMLIESNGSAVLDKEMNIIQNTGINGKLIDEVGKIGRSVHGIMGNSKVHFVKDDKVYITKIEKIN